jgi:hypothetical protein
MTGIIKVNFEASKSQGGIFHEIQSKSLFIIPFGCS